MAGAALGTLLGLLVGLSASPVVGSVVAALTALLAGLFGLSEKLPLGLGAGGARRMAGFGVAATLALLAGLHLRSHQWLAPDVNQLKRQIAELGITDPAEQRQLLKFLRFGLLPDGAKATPEAGKGTGPGASLLYASEAPAFCDELRRLQRDGATPADLLVHLTTGSEAAGRAAARIQALPAPERAAALRAAPLYLCAA
jgi:hypothetical protein